MKIVTSVSALLLLFCLTTFASNVEKSVKLLDCNKGSTCLPMLLDVPDKYAKSIIVSPSKNDVEAAEDSNGYTKFHIRFKGRLNGKVKTIDATFKGYTAGIHCTAFGQGTVGFFRIF